jgi:hypothetical protein
LLDHDRPSVYYAPPRLRLPICTRPSLMLLLRRRLRPLPRNRTTFAGRSAAARARCCTFAAARVRARSSSFRFRSLINCCSAVTAPAFASFRRSYSASTCACWAWRQASSAAGNFRAQLSNRASECSDGRPRPARSRITVRSPYPIAFGAIRRQPRPPSPRRTLSSVGSYTPCTPQSVALM